jgi:hypothetical protein
MSAGSYPETQISQGSVRFYIALVMLQCSRSASPRLPLFHSLLTTCPRSTKEWAGDSPERWCARYWRCGWSERSAGGTETFNRRHRP